MTGIAPCSLRDTIRFANRGGPGAPARVVLPAGTYTLAQGGSGEDDAPAGDLDIRADLALAGAGSGATIVDGGGLDRAFDVARGATVSMAGLTIRNGFPQDSFGNGGGAIKNLGTLSLLAVAIAGNRSTSAGGIFNGGAMSLVACAVVGNRGDYDGGGINNSGAMTIDTSVITENRAPSGGGGVSNGFNTRLTIRSVLIRDNESGGEGGGLVNLSGGVVEALNLYFAGNRANNGGGIDNTGARLIVRDSVVAGNAARGSGGGIRSGFRALGLPAVRLEVAGSAITRNTGDWGGGLYIEGVGTSTIESSDVTENVAGGFFGAGGIYNGGVATLALRNSTIVGNLAPYRAVGDDAPRTAGLLNKYRATATLIHITVADHPTGIVRAGGEVRLRASIVTGPPGARNCFGGVADDGFNLDSGTTCRFDPARGGAANADPLLAAPRTYSVNGPHVYPLRPGSPAIDRIPAAGAGCPPIDARGAARPQGGGCDSGAFELATDERAAGGADRAWPGARWAFRVGRAGSLARENGGAGWIGATVQQP